MAELAELYVEQEERGFQEQEAACPRKHGMQCEVDMPKVPDTRVMKTSSTQSAPKRKRLRSTLGASTP